MAQDTKIMDVHGNIITRSAVNPKEFVIVKLSVPKSIVFSRFVCKMGGYNPYNDSIIHFGNTKITGGNIIELSDSVQTHYTPFRIPHFIRRAACAVTASFVIGSGLFVTPTFAATSGKWNESGYYDTSWYGEETEFTLTTAEQVAGIPVLVNEGKTFAGKIVVIDGKIDMTAHTIVSIPKEFDGVIDGIHNAVLLLAGDGIPFTEENITTPGLSFEYAGSKTSVKYSVSPSYTVTIPAEITLGDSMTVSAENVILEEDKVLTVSISETSGENNAFTLSNGKTGLISYSIKKDDTVISIGDDILSVNPANAASGAVTLSFVPSDETPQFAGNYSGTVTFNLSVQ